MTVSTWVVFLIFAELSVLAFGGGATILPEMQRQLVDQRGWLTAQEFGALFALAQAAPGPNMMVGPLIGWHVAGLKGALAAAGGLFLPSSAITLVGVHAWERFKTHPFRPIIQAGLLPVTAGLVAASALILSQAAAADAMHVAIIVIVSVAAFATRLHPLALLAAGAVAGLVSPF
ncbi:chromate transporter [uncultured Alsobacter sp.]|uniref:chromate transporter n=1 Tax=uncultured Alsobacter sp. TaxID=1748258 RepID=UPI0025D3906E|nr:chromate transporter [uncultured Alsobacter sp.]